MECVAPKLDSTRIQLFGYCGTDRAVYALVCVGYGLLLVVRQIWWTVMSSRFRQELSFPAPFVFEWRSFPRCCRAGHRKHGRSRRLGTIFMNELLNSTLYIV